MQGIDTDNGSEFINHHLARYCVDHGITFTRGRPYHKNDACYVEQKNGHVVRRAVGYGRYDTDQELACCPPSESSWFCTTPPGGVG